MGNATVDAANYNNLGYVRVDWDNTDESVNWYAWRLYRREPNRDNVYRNIAEFVTQDIDYRVDDYLAHANEETDYAVVQVTSTNGGVTQVEGAYTDITVTPFGDVYWIIDGVDPALSIILHHVSSDDFTESYDEATYNLIGRGRKKDQGDRWGASGTLTLTLTDRGGVTARQQALDLRLMKERQNQPYIRDPFGEVTKVGLGDVAFSRVPGAGLAHDMTATLPYDEIA